MKVKIVNTSRHPLPSYATPLSAGVDLHASLEAPVTLAPMQRALIPTGIRIELPAGYEAQVRPRSGLAIKYGLTVLNTPGTIDADYRGEIRVILANLSDTPFTVYNGGRIAQLVVTRCEHVEWASAEAGKFAGYLCRGELHSPPRRPDGDGCQTYSFGPVGGRLMGRMQYAPTRTPQSPPGFTPKTDLESKMSLGLGQKQDLSPRRPSFWAKNRFEARGEGHFAPKTGFRSAATLVSHLNA